MRLLLLQLFALLHFLISVAICAIEIQQHHQQQHYPNVKACNEFIMNLASVALCLTHLLMFCLACVLSLAPGANPNLCDYDGASPLHLAVELQDEDCLSGEAAVADHPHEAAAALL
jgi:ankyrin repeat protein